MPIVLSVSQITVIEQSEPHRRVSHLHGWAGQNQWRHTQGEAIEYIQQGLFSYYLHHNDRAVRLSVGQTHRGDCFLKAESDGESPALLLQLPVANPTHPIYDGRIGAGVAR